MEDQHFLDQESLNIENERPTFLTVLAIITFVVSGFLLIYATFQLLTYSEIEQREAIELMVGQMEETTTNETAEIMGDMTSSIQLMAEENIENHTLFSSISLISILLSLFGAFMMFNMKKTGFHLYLGSKIIGLIPLMFYTLSGLVVGYYILFGFFTLAFVIMYAVNLKHLK
ncbi:MAG: hypothetical protein QMC28_07675 [Flavobacteriales bacterium]